MAKKLINAKITIGEINWEHLKSNLVIYIKNRKKPLQLVHGCQTLPSQVPIHFVLLGEQNAIVTSTVVCRQWHV